MSSDECLMTQIIKFQGSPGKTATTLANEWLLNHRQYHFVDLKIIHEWVPYGAHSAPREIEILYLIYQNKEGDKNAGDE